MQAAPDVSHVSEGWKVTIHSQTHQDKASLLSNDDNPPDNEATHNSAAIQIADKE